VTRVARDDLQRSVQLVLGLSFECGGEVERLEKCLPGVDVLLTNSEEQWIVVGLATDLVAALSPHVDGVDPRERERPVTELWDGVRFLDGGWTDAGAGSDELAGCVAYALVDDSEAVVIGDVACVFQPI